MSCLYNSQWIQKPSKQASVDYTFDEQLEHGSHRTGSKRQNGDGNHVCYLSPLGRHTYLEA